MEKILELEKNLKDIQIRLAIIEIKEMLKRLGEQKCK